MTGCKSRLCKINTQTHLAKNKREKRNIITVWTAVALMLLNGMLQDNAEKGFRRLTKSQSVGLKHIGIVLNVVEEKKVATRSFFSKLIFRMLLALSRK